MTNFRLILPFVYFVVVLSAARVESRPYSGSSYSLFVFGDSFVDTGNLAKAELSETSRQWYLPYGIDWGNRPTGRFSNAMVQSDLVAQILGMQEAPPTYRTRDNYLNLQQGMNFAAGGSSVFEGPHRAPTLDEQVDHFRNLVQAGTITRRSLRDSVALVAFSGIDYDHFINMPSREMIDAVDRVTTEIAKQVRRMRNNGATKILVNNMHPVGCTPMQTRQANYGGCRFRGNMGAELHNEALKTKLNSSDIFIVDLHSAFNNIVNPDPNTEREVSKQFKHKMSPCCESIDPEGYCGQIGDDGSAQYNLCNNTDKYFFWDGSHPTEAGWKAVMTQLEDPIKNFLGLN